MGKKVISRYRGYFYGTVNVLSGLVVAAVTLSQKLQRQRVRVYVTKESRRCRR